MSVSVFVGASVDGFIGRPDGSLDWLPAGGGEGHGYEEFLAGIDAIVIGRKTFETVLGFETWPYGVPLSAVAGFLGSEGAQPLEGRLQNLDDLYAAGFRMMAPTHFTDTAIAGAAAGMKKDGLTDLGRKWVLAMESHHMLIDLAHASPATLRDVTAMATRPLIVSHTGVKGTCNNPRNLSDDELRAVARTTGVVGIGLWDTATCGSDARATARAIHYAINIVGADHVALGSDFDGGITAPFDSSGWALLTDALLQEGISEQDIHKIMGENVVRVLLETLP